MIFYVQYIRNDSVVCYIILSGDVTQTSIIQMLTTQGATNIQFLDALTFATESYRPLPS
jgi:hypothetical protein